MRRIARVILLPLAQVIVAFFCILPLVLSGKTDVPATLALNEHTTQTPLMRATEIALYRVGALSRAEIVLGEDTTAADRFELRVVNSEGLAWCSSNSIAAAIVVAETMARPTFRREIEHSLAQVHNAILGYFPNWSFGMSQAKLSVAKSAFEHANSAIEPIGQQFPVDRDLDVFLALSQADLCQSVAIANLVLASKEGLRATPIEAAISYRGGKSIGDLPQIFTYELLVENLAKRLEFFGRSEDLRISWRPAGDNRESNLYFGVGDWTGSREVFYPHVCLSRYSNLAPISKADLYLPVGAFANSDQELAFDSETVSDFFQSIPSGENSLIIRLRSWDIDADSDAYSRESLDFSEPLDLDGLVDLYAIADTLGVLGIGLDRGWKQVDIDYFEVPDGPDSSRYPCPVEVSISNAGPSIFDLPALQLTKIKEQ